jgi:uncharacterized DUF497 family protein
MDVVYRLQGVEFEWDAEKARSNVAKHGVAFEEAAEVFFDPFYQTGDASVGDEQRDYLGLFHGATLVVSRIHRTP